jgi:hypothetical protein
MSYITVQTKKSYDFYLRLVDDLIQLLYNREQETTEQGVTDAAPVIARYDIQNEHVQVKMEYFIYINQYGVPADGIFVEELLQKIRNGLIN